MTDEKSLASSNSHTANILEISLLWFPKRVGWDFRYLHPVQSEISMLSIGRTKNKDVRIAENSQPISYIDHISLCHKDAMILRLRVVEGLMDTAYSLCFVHGQTGRTQPSWILVAFSI